MLQKTNQSKLYRNIGYYSGRYAMIDDKQWIRSLKKNKNKYELEHDTSTPMHITSIKKLYYLHK